MAPAAVYQINPRIIYENIDGEVIMINLDVGFYFSLHNVAAEIWSLFENKVRSEHVVELIAKQYQQNAPDIESMIASFLNELEKEQLIVPIEASELTAEESNTESVVALEQSKSKTSFTPPKLEKYDDMEQLLLIDPVHEVNEEGWPNRMPAIESEDQ